MSSLAFTIPGPPRGKGRPKFARMAGFVRAYTDAKTASYENLVAIAAAEAHRGRPVLDGPLRVEILFVLPRPKSLAKKPRALPITRPDVDNLQKAVLDGANQAGVWRDDAQVVDVHARKVYGTPRCEVTITPLVGDGPLFAETPMDVQTCAQEAR